MKNSNLLIIVLVVSACASVYETHAPDGRKAYALNCSGLARGWDKCLQAAGEKCSENGYDVIDRSSEDAIAVGGSSSGFSGGKTNERSMLIACKTPKPSKK